MPIEIIVALIGVAGALAATYFGVKLSAQNNKERSNDQPVVNYDPTNTVDKPKEPVKRYVGNMVDFFEGITDESPLKVELAVNDDGRIIFFYTKDLKVHLRRIEFLIDERRVVFVAENGTTREFGMALDKSVSEPLKQVEEVLMVKLDSQSGAAIPGATLPLKIYS
ncbi:MAG: hypothetical protein ACRBCS_11500 [Cellvibrionaceae bacterium]